MGGVIMRSRGDEHKERGDGGEGEDASWEEWNEMGEYNVNDVVGVYEQMLIQSAKNVAMGST